jgi:hypothetical protein
MPALRPMLFAALIISSFGRQFQGIVNQLSGKATKKPWVCTSSCPVKQANVRIQKNVPKLFSTYIGNPNDVCRLSTVIRQKQNATQQTLNDVQNLKFPS